MNSIGVLIIVPLCGSYVSVTTDSICSSKKKKLLPAKHDNSIALPLEANQVVTIGRIATNDIHINNQAVSSHHALIWSTKFDEKSPALFYIRDCSRNGVLVNGIEIGKGNTQILESEDVIGIQTAAELTFKCHGDSTSSQEIWQSIDDWKITQKLIGNGSFGTVFVAKKSHSKKLFAVKVIQNQCSSYFNSNDVSTHESKMLRNINHPNIIRFYDTLVFNSTTFIFQDLICGGDLFSYLVKNGFLRALPEKEAILIVFQLMKILKYLHKELQIVHRDVKLDNVLLELPIPRTKIYLCDFGIAKCIGTKRTNTCVGTIEYSAPEVFRHDSTGKQSIYPYDFKCDMWSLGVITHILLSGISPFYSECKDQIMKASRLGILNLRKPQFSNVSQPAKSFIAKLLDVDPSRRMDIDDCFNHEWIRINRSKLEKFYVQKEKK